MKQTLARQVVSTLPVIFCILAFWLQTNKPESVSAAATPARAAVASVYC